MKVKGLFYLWLVSFVLLLGIAQRGIAEDRHAVEAVNATSGVPYFTDDFENGLGNWVVSGLDWGLTTSTYRGGNYSVTDSPSGNYADNTNASLTLAGSIDLTGSTSPVLTFWHKYDLAVDDYIYVEISTDGGFEWSSLSSWYSTTTSTWQLAQIDLRSYKTFNNVKIRFRLYESYINEADGWHIDDIAIKEKDTTKTSYPFSDDFESGLGNWVVSGWDWGLTTSTYRGGNYSVTDSPSGNYADNTNASLTLAGSIDLTGSTSPVLTFWHKYDLAVDDYIYVEISTDGGFEWSSLSSWYSTTTSTWQLAQIDLRSYKTFNNVKIRFRLYESYINEADGWHIDDMEIKEKGTSTPTTTTTTTTSTTTTTDNTGSTTTTTSSTTTSSTTTSTTTTSSTTTTTLISGSRKWIQLIDNGISTGAMAYAYDGNRNRGVIFGGDDSSLNQTSNTYEWNGTSWTFITSQGPSSRVNSAMSYDAAHGKCVLFGGWVKPDNYYGDTWTWNGTQWSQVSSTGPHARANQAMAYDSSRGKVVLFGGSYYQTIYGDTWEWDGTSWTQVSSGGPSSRLFARMAYDEARGKVVLFGGQTTYYGTFLNDTWEWDGTSWQQVATTGPSARSWHTMAYDSTRQRVVLFGGGGWGRAESFNDTWEWDGTLWAQADAYGPSARIGASMFYDKTLKAPILFGGYNNGSDYSTLGDTWKYSNEDNTTNQNPTGSIVINGDDAYTKSTAVTLSLSATDDTGVVGYYISTNNTTPSATGSGWTDVASTTSYSGSVSYTLSGSDGTKRIYAWFKDTGGSVSDTASDDIILDTTGPTVTITSPTSSSTYTTTSSTISLGGSASDSASSISSVTWSSDKGIIGTASGTTSWSVSISLSNGDNVITITATDGAGNAGTDTITVFYDDNSSPQGIINGYTIDTDIDPVKEVEVAITGTEYSGTTETDQDGFYSFWHLPAGDYELTYEKKGYATQTKKVSLGEDEVIMVNDITMILETSPVGLVYGTVNGTYEDTLEGVTVTITGEGISDSTETDEDGYYEFQELAAGDYTLTYEKEDYVTQKQEISLEEGEEKDLGTINMSLQSSIYGYVFNVKGDPINKARLKLKGINTKYVETKYSDGDGYFEFTGLEADTYLIFVRKKGYLPKKIRVPLEEGEEKDVGEIILRRKS